MRSPPLPPLLCLALALTALTSSRPAAATDTWSSPHSGVFHLHRSTGTPWEIDVALIDLCTDGVSLRATKSDERQRRTSAFGALVGADVAINGDFFSYSTYGTSGLAVGDGQPWPDTSDGGGSGFVAFGLDRAELSPPAAVVGYDSWMEEVVSGNVLLVDGGVAMATDSGSFCTTRHPRTAAGFTADGRTLILAVVDGRSSASAGMRCSELASLMRGLGAHDAVNLDGGGSTTMWISGEGVVNDPSDGSERVVANHLGVYATGLLERPRSCDRTLEEAALLAGSRGGGTTTDVDGDGLADLCGLGPDGLQCALSGASDWPVVTRADVSSFLPPEDEAAWATLRFGDIDGDGLADACGRGEEGVRCWRSEGDGFAAALVGPELSDADGWWRPEYYGTLRVADIDGDGRDDLCARAGVGVQCWLSLGDAFAPALSGPELSDAQGWAHPRYYGTLRFGDIDGDGRDDLCARAAAGMRCWRSTGDGFGGSIVGPEWSDAAGWDALAHWPSVRLLDVDGDGRADLCGRGPDGLSCHLSLGDGFGPASDGPSWSDASGWGDYANASTLRFGDLDGDGDQDVCARANAGVVCHRWDSAAGGFEASAVVGPELGDAGAWDLLRFHSTLRLADVDGDGRADLCARGWSRVTCSLSDGAGFPDEVEGPAWGEAAGWGEPFAFSTLRLIPPPPPPPEPVPGDDDDTAPTGDDDDANDDDDGAGAPDDDDGPGAPDDDDRLAIPDPEAGPWQGPPGCSCSASAGAPSRLAEARAIAHLILLLPLALRRRRSS